MTTVATFAIATDSIAGSYLRSPPTVTVTAPIGTVTSENVTVTWTYYSAASRPQVSYRVKLLTATSGTVLYDSGTVAGAGTSLLVPFDLTGFSSYIASVEVSDVFDIGTGTSPFYVELGGAVESPTNTQVGSVYEVGINGIGYMLTDGPEGATRYKRQTVQLDPSRLATGDTPFSEAVERYTFIGHSNWIDGEGQLYLDRTNSSKERYWYSEGVNPFNEGKLSCLQAVENFISTTYTPLAVTAGGYAYVLTAANTITRKASRAAAATTFSPFGGGTVIGLCSDGQYWYATDGTNVRRNNTDANPGANWSTIALKTIEWCSDRIAGFYNAAPTFTTLGPTGTEEVPSGRETFTGAALQGLTAGDGYTWFGVNRGGIGGRGEIRAWNIGSASTSFIALTLPNGEIVDNIFFYLGNVFVASINDVLQRKIYRCIPQEGSLTPELVVDNLGGGASTALTPFCGIGRFVAFGWKTMTRTGKAGIGVIDLDSGGYARWFSCDQAAAVTSIIRWDQGRFGFTVDGYGMYSETSAGTYVNGFLETSVSDLATSVPKIVDTITLTTQPLSGSITLKYSLDSNETFVTLGAMSGSGSTSVDIDANLQCASIGLRVDFTCSPTTISPVLKLLVAKTHPLGLVDQVVTLTVDASNKRRGINGHELPDNGPQRGIRTARALEALVGVQVSFQDVDWPVTNVSQDYQVVSAEYTSLGVANRHLNRREDGGVVVMSLRRPL